MEAIEYKKEWCCDPCVHFTKNDYDLICGCSLLEWWNEPRLGLTDKGMMFVKPNKCTRWKENIWNNPAQK